MTCFVLDTSVSLSWIFADEFSAYSQFVQVVLNEGEAFVPVVWPLEVVNGILNAIRRKRLLEADAQPLLGRLARLRIQAEPGSELAMLSQSTLTLGLAHRLSAYDASYLELAIRRGLPLATQDRKLVEAATAVGVELLQP